MAFKYLLLQILLLSCSHPNNTEDPGPSIVIQLNESKTAQAIHNFGASDAWSCQFIGNWPDEKKNAIADLLFSMDTTANGKPKGIGLTMWRYNIGAGSANQGSASGINDEWRRAASLTGSSGATRIQAQNWFLSAAKKRGVERFLAFYNSPPVELTINNKAFANNGVCNIDSNNYTLFARQALNSLRQIESSTGVRFDYISPVNEPQWDWSDGGQEGCPYTNAEISKLVKSFDTELASQNVKILVPEAGHIKYLLPNSDKLNRDDQVNTFFDPASPGYLGNLRSVYPAIATHSYFSNSPYREAIDLRNKINALMGSKNGLAIWQSEYCILGDNAGEINGSGRDLGMTSALYVAKVIHQDLVWLNASAWQWWLAVSPYDYKDGLVYVDKNESNGNFYESKMLWAMGNYSRFIRPGMIRVESTVNDNDLLVTSFKDNASGKVVMVIANLVAIDKPVALNRTNSSMPRHITTYTTNESKSLDKKVLEGGDLVAPARSVMTVIIE